MFPNFLLVLKSKSQSVFKPKQWEWKNSNDFVYRVKNYWLQFCNFHQYQHILAAARGKQPYVFYFEEITILPSRPCMWRNPLGVVNPNTYKDEHTGCHTHTHRRKSHWLSNLEDDLVVPRDRQAPIQLHPTEKSSHVLRNECGRINHYST